MLKRFAMNTLLSRGYATGAGRILVLADHDHKKLSPTTLSVVTAANKIGSDVTLLVAGKGTSPIAEAAKSVAGVKQVLHVDHEKFEHFLPEPLTGLLTGLQKEHKFSHILGSASSVAKNTLPRLAAKLDVSMLSEIIEVQSPDTFKRPTYAGNVIATVQTKDLVVVASVRTTAFDKSAPSGGSASVTPASADALAASAAPPTQWLSAAVKQSDRPELGSAKVIISGGRALKDAATFSALLEPLAKKLGAAIGASRAAVDANFCANDMQIGQTGKIVAPELYIAIGISGAIQHLAGMKDSKVIVAINKDADAPIFAVADYGLVGDLFQIVPELVKKL